MKRFIFVLLVVLSLSIGSSFAREVYKQINVYNNDIKIQVDQKEINLEKPGFIFEGHVYVPLRYFSEAIGYTVNWNSQIRTVSLYKEPIKPQNPLAGEGFIYGQIMSLNYNTRVLTLEQYLDDNSRDVYNNLKVIESAVVALERNKKEFLIDFLDLKVGDMVGLIVSKNNEIRGIIIYT